MSAPDDDLESLRGEVNDHLVDRLLDPVGGPEAAVAGSPDAAAMAPAQSDDDGPFDVALGPGAIQAIRDAMARAGADRRLDATIGRMTGGQFSPEQVHTLEDRALQHAGIGDPLRLMGIQEGPPVVLSRSQKSVVDRLMTQSATDPLGREAQSAYQKAWKNGQIRLGGN